MQNYRNGNKNSTLVKGIMLIVGVVIVIFLAKQIMSIVVSILVLAAIAIGIWLVIKFLSRSNRGRNRF